MKRIQYLDGYRGLAILMVIFFHAYVRWTEIVPYGDAYKNVGIFKYGNYGVLLFFLISGFVILMTLEKSKGVVSFIYKRWLRLFPAMLICTIILILTASLFPYRPVGEVRLIDAIPGLLFIDPYFFLEILGINIQSIEHSFWSLYVEFQFYIFAVFVYFIVGSRGLVFALFGCLIFWCALKASDLYLEIAILSKLYTLVSALSFQYFGWFAAGAAFYLHTKHASHAWFVFACVICIVSSLVGSWFKLAPFIAAVIVSGLFALTVVSQRLQKLVANPFLLYLGVVSYPLYMLHENMMISFTVQAHKAFEWFPSWLLPLLGVGLLSVVCYFIVTLLEPRVKRVIQSFFCFIVLKFNVS